MTARTVETAPDGAGSDVGVSVGDLEDARLGFLHLLRRKGLSQEFTERHLDDMLAQAAYELSRKLEQGERIERPAGWMVICAWNRTKNEFEARARRPRLVSTDSLVTEPVAEESWEPEETFLAEDTMRKVHEAVEQLPAHQRELIERAYFEGESVREAARQMGWSPAKAQRAHEAAREKLRLILGERKYIELEIGLAAFISISSAARAAAADVPTGLDAALQRMGHAVSNGWHKATDLARHPLGGGRSAGLEAASPSGSGRLSEIGGRLATSPVGEAVAASGDAPGRLAEVCKGLAVCVIVGVPTAVSVGFAGSGHGSPAGSPAVTRPAQRQSRQPRSGGAARADAHVLQPPQRERAESTPPGEHTAGSSEADVPSKNQELSDSSAPATVTTKEKWTDEEAQVRKGLEPYGKRSEARSSESTAAETSSLTATDTSSGEETEAESTPTPKESVEHKKAAEQFQGALR
jgi:RNA polymerase sigma factor (sigma-70 family)